VPVAAVATGAPPVLVYVLIALALVLVTCGGATPAAVSPTSGVEIAVLPPFTHLFAVRGVLDGTGLLVGAQDVFWEDSGAYTGEISPPMLAKPKMLAL